MEFSDEPIRDKEDPCRCRPGGLMFWATAILFWIMAVALIAAALGFAAGTIYA